MGQTGARRRSHVYRHRNSRLHLVGALDRVSRATRLNETLQTRRPFRMSSALLVGKWCGVRCPLAAHGLRRSSVHARVPRRLHEDGGAFGVHRSRRQRPSGLRGAVARRSDRARGNDGIFGADDARDDGDARRRAGAGDGGQDARRHRSPVGRTHVGGRGPGLVAGGLRERRSRFRGAVGTSRRSRARVAGAVASRVRAVRPSFLFDGGGPPIWLGSWGSDAGLRRVARLADGWLASAYNTTPELFADARARLGEHLRAHGKEPDLFPNGLATMWFYITEDRTEADHIFRERLAPAIHRPAEELRERLPVGPGAAFAEKLTAFGDAGVQRGLVWPVAHERRQLELFCEKVRPLV